ncbi:hypothetical protein L3Y34_000098 [Caenorhabditis briggsae]|uniref:Uncharacterized protein n=1 Tax=Caenorhabditis briggsae TaxID=6238 RepID=A0AAE9IL90_CAEBR|nr:hypothetical protein L3Y34_000098 [Caenorhabditis briggsae]
MDRTLGRGSNWRKLEEFKGPQEEEEEGHLDVDGEKRISSEATVKAAIEDGTDNNRYFAEPLRKSRANNKWKRWDSQKEFKRRDSSHFGDYSSSVFIGYFVITKIAWAQKLLAPRHPLPALLSKDQRTILFYLQLLGSPLLRG